MRPPRARLDAHAPELWPAAALYRDRDLARERDRERDREPPHDVTSALSSSGGRHSGGNGAVSAEERAYVRRLLGDRGQWALVASLIDDGDDLAAAPGAAQAAARAAAAETEAAAATRAAEAGARARVAEQRARDRAAAETALRGVNNSSSHHSSSNSGNNSHGSHANSGVESQGASAAAGVKFGVAAVADALDQATAPPQYFMCPITFDRTLTLFVPFL